MALKFSILSQFFYYEVYLLVHLYVHIFFNYYFLFLGEGVGGVSNQ